MSYGTREVGPNRYREDIGRYYEDFEIGAVYEHRPGRTINDADNSWFTLLTMNTHPLHFDTKYASHSEFGKPLVNSLFTLGLMIGISVNDTTHGTTIAKATVWIAAPALLHRNGDILVLIHWLGL